MKTNLPLALALLLSAGPAYGAETWEMARTPDGKPDLQGIWSNATQTPLERPAEFGATAFLTLEQKEEQEARWRQVIADRAQPSDPNRDAPPVADRPGGYNNFWAGPGTCSPSFAACREWTLLTGRSCAPWANAVCWPSARVRGRR